MKKETPSVKDECLFLGDPAEARTLGPQIKSLLLYQLSYGVSIMFE